MIKRTLLLVGLVGCFHESPLGSTHDGPRATVYDDGTQIRVTGCPDSATLGCHTPAYTDTMTVTVDGTLHGVPQSSQGATADQLLGLFSDGPFQITLPRPGDGQLAIELAGAQAQIALPKSFAIDPPPAQWKRSNGILTITHEALAGARTWGVVISTCGSREHTDAFEEKSTGVLEVRFPSDSSGTCTHAIHVDQRTTIPGAELSIDAYRIGVVTVTSTP